MHEKLRGKVQDTWSVRTTYKKYSVKCTNSHILEGINLRISQYFNTPYCNASCVICLVIRKTSDNWRLGTMQCSKSKGLPWYFYRELNTLCRDKWNLSSFSYKIIFFASFSGGNITMSKIFHAASEIQYIYIYIYKYIYIYIYIYNVNQVKKNSNLSYKEFY